MQQLLHGRPLLLGIPGLTLRLQRRPVYLLLLLLLICISKGIRVL